MALALAVVGCAGGSSFRQEVGRPIPVPLGTISSASATLAQARALDRAGQAQSVDLYFQATVQAAEMIPPGTSALGESAQVYREALAELIDAGQRYERLDPRGRLTVNLGGPRVVPIRYFGFAWRPQDFNRLTPAGEHGSRHLAKFYGSAGLGVPLVVERIAACPEEVFFPPWMPFAATAVLWAGPEGHVLELYNPLAFETITWHGAPSPLASDLTAPLSAIINRAPKQYLRGFTAPSDTSVRPKLVMLEPYQRGKIPVVLIHGLYSDPTAWADMINGLRVERDLYDQFQFWTFRYPTGGDMLHSAAALRQNLRLARATYDPQHTDPAMDQMVLVGHSLGGLMSKMQVTYSYEILWRQVADQPFDRVRASTQLQERLAQGFFFEPVSNVKRVIFIGTPHKGSGMARRLAGMVGNALVEFGQEEDLQYDQLMEDNSDVFKPIVQRARPTTVTLLNPESPALAGLAQMPINPAVHLHSIIGTGGLNPLEPGDGIVSVESAQHCGESELFVPTHHEKLHRDPASIAEVARILRMHAVAGR